MRGCAIRQRRREPHAPAALAGLPSCTRAAISAVLPLECTDVLFAGSLVGGELAWLEGSDRFCQCLRSFIVSSRGTQQAYIVPHGRKYYNSESNSMCFIVLGWP